MRVAVEYVARADLAVSLALYILSQHTAAMTKSITVRGVPTDVRDELAARAARTGRSLQEYIRLQLVELARRPDSEVLIARIRDRKATTASHLSRERILEYREADRP